MARWSHLIVWCCFTITLDLTNGDFTCVETSPNPKDPTPPFFPGDSYQTHVEVNIVDKNYTMDVEEYLDYEGNRGLMKITRNGEITSVIYSYDTDEVFYIKDQQCTVKNLTTDSLSFLYGYGQLDGDIRHIFGSSASLRYAQTIHKVYKGRSKVRGISAEAWSSCIKWPHTVGSIQLTYYFNTLEWSPATVNVQIPLRIEVEGMSTNDGSLGKQPTGKSHHFYHVYDFINYVPAVLADPSIFETPTDVVCVGRLKTKSLPSFSPKFQYKAEEIDPAVNLISSFAVWYDEDAELVREDKIYKVPEAPLYNTRPVTEIHDFKTGIRYIRDRILGNCSVWPISVGESDAQEDIARYKHNQSLVIGMKDPHKFFKINDNYTYTGQREVRGILCDVYSVEFPNYKLGKIETNTTFHYFFMAEYWIDASDTGPNVAGKRYPVRLEIRSQQLDIVKIYNFYDFEDRHSPSNVFDVSDCFEANKKLGIKITFPGTYFPSTEENWINSLYYGLANVMEIPPIRISKLSIKHDSKNVYVKATLLGMSNAAQFQLVSHMELEHADDKMYPGVGSSQECAKLCINNPDFVCRGYDFCPDHNNACHLSRSHIQNHQLLPNATVCDHYSRTVANILVKEPSLSEAYAALQTAIVNQTFFISIQNPDGFIAIFTPIEAEITSGFLSPTKTLPSLPSQFSYRLESIVPGLKRASDTYVWYDSVLKLVRMDSRNLDQYPYYETSQIHDFTTGISYNINKVTGQCNLSPIPSKDVFDVDSEASKANKDAGIIVKMKSPLELLYLDDSYQYIGQETVRGIKCDVFQTRRTDFHITFYGRTVENSVFTFYFQADDWSYYTTDSLDTTISQPVKLKIEDTEVEQVLIFNFFDFNDEHHTLDHYDASPCFGSEEKKSFVITFKNQPYHPTLDDATPSFINDAIIKLAESANISPIRFQKASVTYDETNVYLLITALGAVPYGVLFTPVQKTTMNKMAISISTRNSDECATACLQISSFRCQSFDFCPNQKPSNCLPEHPRGLDPNYGHLNQTGDCIHYSLTEDGVSLMLGVDSVYRSLQRAIYRDKIKILINGPNAQDKVYSASNIRDDVIRTTRSANDAGTLLQKFHEIKNSKFNDTTVMETHRMMGITDCTLKCLQEATFHCQAFEFNFNTGTCRLAKQHPDEMTAPLSVVPDTSVYSLLYSIDYKKMAGSVLSVNTDKTLNNVATIEMCARACDEEVDFRCESFDYCGDSKTCNLGKTNTLSPGQPAIGLIGLPACSHYSRNYFFDFEKHPNKVIYGHDDVIVSVDNSTQCAVLCATGELKGCSSFEICQEQRGLTLCKLSVVDPTVNKSLSITDSLQCSLYTVANPKTPFRCPRCPRYIISEPKTVTPSVNCSTGSHMPTKQRQNAGESSDTGQTVGIAFGAMFLGVLFGSLGMFMYFRLNQRKMTSPDTHPLNSMS